MNKLCIGAALITCFVLLCASAARHGDARFFHFERLSLAVDYKADQVGFHISYDDKGAATTCPVEVARLSVRDLLLM